MQNTCIWIQDQIHYHAYMYIFKMKNDYISVQFYRDGWLIFAAYTFINYIFRVCIWLLLVSELMHFGTAHVEKEDWDKISSTLSCTDLRDTFIWFWWDGLLDYNVHIIWQDTPPVYNVSAMTTPTVLYWADHDWLADPKVNTYKSPFTVITYVAIYLLKVYWLVHLKSSLFVLITTKKETIMFVAKIVYLL